MTVVRGVERVEAVGGDRPLSMYLRLEVVPTQRQGQPFPRTVLSPVDRGLFRPSSEASPLLFHWSFFSDAIGANVSQFMATSSREDHTDASEQCSGVGKPRPGLFLSRSNNGLNSHWMGSLS